MTTVPSRHTTRRRACRCALVASLAAVALIAAAGCASRTKVELESAQGPSVQPADGGDGQNEAEVVDAGAIDIDDEPVAATTLPADDTTTEASTATTDAPSPTSENPGTTDEEPEMDPAVKRQCKGAKQTLKSAVENYRFDLGTAPTSEADLIANSYLRAASDLYDVRVDGSVVVQGTTCAALG